MKKFYKFVLILSFVFALSFNMFANFGKAFAETTYRTTQEEINQNGYITYNPFPYNIDLELPFRYKTSFLYRYYAPDITSEEYSRFDSFFSNYYMSFPCKYILHSNYNYVDFNGYSIIDRIRIGDIYYSSDYIYLNLDHSFTYSNNGNPLSKINIPSNYIQNSLYFEFRSKLDYYFPLEYNGNLFLFEMFSFQFDNISNTNVRIFFQKNNQIPFSFSVATVQPNCYFYPDSYDKTFLLDKLETSFAFQTYSLDNIPTTYPVLTHIITDPYTITDFFLEVQLEEYQLYLTPSLFNSGSMENLQTDYGVPFIVELYDFNFYPSLFEGVSNSIVSGLPDTVTCAWYDIPCHLGNALVYFMKEFPLTKPIMNFIDGAFILLALPFDLLLQLSQTLGNSLFIGFVFLLVVLIIVRYFMR